MPGRDEYATLRKAFSAVRVIKDTGDQLKATSGAIDAFVLMQSLNGMRNAYLNGIKPLLDLGNAAQINPVIVKYFSGMPANPYVQMQAVGTALLTFYTEYDALFTSVTFVTFSIAAGHEYAQIPLASLAGLVDELDAVIAAATPLVAAE